jgi:hypothetical protein
MPDSERNPGMQVLTCSEFVIRVGRGVSSERIKTSAVPSAFGLGYAKSIGMRFVFYCPFSLRAPTTNGSKRLKLIHHDLYEVESGILRLSDLGFANKPRRPTGSPA